MDVIIGQTVLCDIKLAIFDKDGTLIDVHTYWANMIRFRADFISMKLGGLDKKTRVELMESMGVDVKTMRIKPQGPVGLKKRELVMQAGIDYLESEGHSDLEPLFEEAFKEVDEQSLSRFDQIINIDHPLVRLSSIINWEAFEEKFGSFVSSWSRSIGYVNSSYVRSNLP